MLRHNPPFKRQFISFALSLGLLGANMAAWSADAANRLLEIKPNMSAEQLTLRFSGKTHGDLTINPDTNQLRRLVIDFPGTTLDALPEKDALLAAIKRDLVGIREVSLNEFRTPEPMVRLTIQSDTDNLTVDLVQNDDTTVVLQLLQEIHESSAEAETENSEPAKPTLPPQQRIAATAEKPVAAPQPTGNATPAASASSGVAPAPALANAMAQRGSLSEVDKVNTNTLESLIQAERQYRQGRQAAAQGNWSKAREHYRQAAQLAPQVSEYTLALAGSHMAQGDYTTPDQLLLPILKRNPSHPQVLNELGKTAMARKEYPKALDYFRRAFPVDILSNYASALRRNDQPDEAEKVYRLALDARPTDSELHFNLGNLHLSQKRFAEAEQSYREALRMKPGFAEAHYQLGLVYAQTGQPTEAIDSLTHYLKVMPQAPNKASVEQFITQLKAKRQ